MMSNNQQMIKYEGQGFWQKLKHKILSIFSKKYREKEQLQYVKTQDTNEQEISKEEFFDIYKKVKNNEIDIYTLDDDIIDKLVKILSEELKTEQEKLEDTYQKIDISFNNIKMYQKEILLLKRNS